MAKSVSNADIEDVLSSIRRLVSTEDREQHKEAGTVGEEQAEDKLVLSPSQRVDSRTAVSEQSPNREVALNVPDATGEDGQEDASVRHEPEEAAPENTDGKTPWFQSSGYRQETIGPEAAVEPEQSTPQEPGRSDADDEDPQTVQAETDAPEMQADAQDDRDELDLLDDALPDSDDLNELEKRIAGVEAAVAATEDEWEPDGQSDDAYSGGPVSALPWEDDVAGTEDPPVQDAAVERADAVTPEAVAEETADESDLDESYAHEPPVDQPKAEDLTADQPNAEEPHAEEPNAEEPHAEEPNAEEPHADHLNVEDSRAEVRAVEPDINEPDADEPDAEEPDADWPQAEDSRSGMLHLDQPDMDKLDEDHQDMDRSPEEEEAEAAAETAETDPPRIGTGSGTPGDDGDTGEAAEDDTALTWYTEDAVIDEEALRDMVSDIVRQELQGALGERITRNVRKLVRREIHRALTSQKLD